MSDPPQGQVEAERPEARTLQRIQAELAAFTWGAGAIAPERALGNIVRILEAAGYAVGGPDGGETERFLRSWSDPDRQRG